jgi:hypothetical protein
VYAVCARKCDTNLLFPEFFDFFVFFVLLVKGVSGLIAMADWHYNFIKLLNIFLKCNNLNDF